MNEQDTGIEMLTIKLKNKRLALVPHEDGCSFYSKTLTKDTGKRKSVVHNISKNKKIRVSGIHLSDETAIGLFHLLKEYLKM